MVISMVAGLSIGITNSKTYEKIAFQREQVVKSSLELVFPQGLNIEERRGSGKLPDRYWVAVSEQGIEGYAFEVSSRGYSSDIRFMAGVFTDGTITGITILDQRETPGLGSRVSEVASENYLWTALFKSSPQSLPWFTEQFRGITVFDPIGVEKSLGEWHSLNTEKRKMLKENNQITAITGSTISTDAVINGLKLTIAGYLQELARKK